jgi:hypothetical protein
MRLFPSRDDVAMALIMGECGRTHDFQTNGLVVTETETDASGRTINVSRVACQRCGMVRVSRWQPPASDAPPSARAVLSRYERPQPGDVPGITERARLVSDTELAEFIAERGLPVLPPGFAPDRRTTATTERLDLVLSIRAGMFALLDRGRSLGTILPLPPYAESAGLIDSVPGAALCWAPVDEGELALTVVVSAVDPGPPDRPGERTAELSFRSHSGHVVLCELAGRTLELPPLPAGHGDYRLRYHVADSGCVLRIWHQPRTRPTVHSSR